MLILQSRDWSKDGEKIRRKFQTLDEVLEFAQPADIQVFENYCLLFNKLGSPLHDYVLRTTAVAA